MAAPSLISYTEVAWNTGAASKATASISWQTGDVLVVLCGCEAADTMGTPTATGLTFTKNQSIATASRCGGFCATAVAASSSSGAVTVTNTSSSLHHWGFGVWVWRSSVGVGNSVSQSTATKTVSLTPVAADSAICWAAFDFNADAAGSGTPAVSNTRQAAQDAGRYTRLVVDLIDQTGTGAVSYGQSGGGTTGPFTIVVQEVQSTGGGGGGVTVTYPELERHTRGVGRGVLSAPVYSPERAAA